MLHNNKGESFVGIVVWVLLLSFVVLAIMNLLIFSYDVTQKHFERNNIDILSNNLSRVIKALDTSALVENEVFYVHKNRAAGNIYEIKRGASNDFYRFVNKHGETIDVDTYEWEIYSQILWVAKEDTSITEQDQVIRVSIKRLTKR